MPTNPPDSLNMCAITSSDMCPTPFLVLLTVVTCYNPSLHQYITHHITPETTHTDSLQYSNCHAGYQFMISQLSHLPRSIPFPVLHLLYSSTSPLTSIFTSLLFSSCNIMPFASYFWHHSDDKKKRERKRKKHNPYPIFHPILDYVLLRICELRDAITCITKQTNNEFRQIPRIV